MLPDIEPYDHKSIVVFQYPCILSDEALDAEEEEFDLDMEIIKPPLARPQDILREKGTMLKCVHDLYGRASKNLPPEVSAKVKELLVHCVLYGYLP